MIPQDTVQQILQAADIVEVVGDFVSLKKRGASMIACCPFHNEKTPSFYISPSKGIYKCFGCGKGGDALKFVMELEGLTYPDALRWLAKKYSIEIKEREYTDLDLLQQNEKESLFIVLEYAKNHFLGSLKETDEGKDIGLSYFKERGFSQQIIDRFELGYAPEQRDGLFKKAEQAGFSREILDKAGLISIKENEPPKDRFRGRVVFPIHNVGGKTVAFGARILKSDPKAPKYINSPETEVYVKSRIVYGIYQAKNAIRQLDNCFLVEGYTDVVSLHQAGIENVVASSGTSLTADQVRLIRRFSRNITVLYDGDAAGIKASLRGIDIILEEDMNVKSVVFPDGDDPDSYIKKVGASEFAAYVKRHEKDFIRFKTELSLAEVGTDPIKKANLISDLVNTITKIPDAIKREVFYKEVSGLMNIDELVLITEANKILRDKIKKPPLQRTDGGGTVEPEAKKSDTESEILNKTDGLNQYEEALVRDLVLYGNVVIDKDEESGETHTLADYLIEETNDILIENAVLRRVFELYLGIYEKNENVNTQTFTSHQDEEIQMTVINWLSPKHGLSDGWEKFEIYVPKYQDLLEIFSYKLLLRIRKEKAEKEIEELLKQLTDDISEEDEEVLLAQKSKKDKVVQKYAKLLGTII
jgi:DNA primase